MLNDIKATDSETYLEHVLRSAYLFVLAEQDGYVSSIGTEEMSDMLMYALCNEFGCERFSNWVESRIE